MTNSTLWTLSPAILRSPEGEEVGGGGEIASQDQVAATPDDSAASVEATEHEVHDEASLFDFESSDTHENSNGDSPESEEEGEGEESDYSLDLGSSFAGTDDERAMITSKAKECGLPAEAASSFVAQVLDELNEARIENDRAQLNSLRETWGSKFDANMRETKRFIKELTAKESFPEETLQFLKTPHAFRLANALRTRISEGGTKGLANAEAQTSRKQQIDDFNNNPNNPYHKILSNPMNSHSEDYKKAAKHINALLGADVF